MHYIRITLLVTLLSLQFFPSPAQEKLDTKTNINTFNTDSHLALRANLLRWVTLTPNLGIEWRFADQWSASLAGSWTSWKWSGETRRYALWEVAPELRYYFEGWQHFYLGVQYKQGEFNYLLREIGRQGEILGGGLTFGYMLPLGNAFALDFKLGAGCLHSDYESYRNIGGVRVKDGDFCENKWGPTDLGVTLVWKFK